MHLKCLPILNGLIFSDQDRSPLLPTAVDSGAKIASAQCGNEVQWSRVAIKGQSQNMSWRRSKLGIVTDEPPLHSMYRPTSRNL